MSAGQTERQTTRVGFWIVVFFLLCGSIGIICTGISSSMGDDILGQWKGAVKNSRGALIKVKLTVAPGEAELDFGAPRNCMAIADYITLETEAHVYRLAAKSGQSLKGWCKNLRNGTMTLTKDRPATLSFHIANSEKTISENTTLCKIDSYGCFQSNRAPKLTLHYFQAESF